MNDRAKVARSASRAMGATLQSVCDRLPVGFALFGADLRLAAWNARFAALCSYPRKLVRAGTPLEAFVRIEAERGDHGAGVPDALVRDRLALLKRRKRVEHEQAQADGRCVRIVAERIPEGGLLVVCEDVTDASRIAHRLRESDERYDVAMRASNEGMYDWDVSNDSVHYSERVYQAVGMSPDDYTTAAGWFERIHPDDQKRYLDAIRAHFKGETDRFECDYRYRARDGSWHWARQHGLALRDASGRAVRLIGSTGNITELKERELQLADQAAEQAAVRQLLEAISRSAFDLDAVLRTLIESAARLCHAERAFIFRRDGDAYRLAVDYGGVTPEFREFIAQHPIRPGRDTLVGRTALTKTIVHIEDVLADPEYRWPQSQRMGGQRSMLGVPIVRDDAVVGVIALWKERVEPFTLAQIQLVATFSSQAAIAIENVRLFNETKDALERQTATAEILKVISSSPTEIQPVLDAVAERAGKLCDAPYANVMLVEGDALNVMSVYSTEPGPRPDQRNFVPLRRSFLNARAVLDREVIHIPDVVPLIDSEFPDIRRNQEKFGFRAVLVVPLLREGRAVGTIFLWRREAGPFSDEQVALLRTFADQAVIAIENVRLFNETKEALERQRATADVLASISGSLADTQPVFERIVKNVRQLFGTRFSVLQLLRRDMVEMPAVDGSVGFERLRDRYPRPLDDTTVGGRAMLSKQTLQFAPVLENPATPSATIGFARDFGFNSVIFTPMIHEGTVIGAIGAAHPGAREFDERQVALLRTFADQAVIAIQNARLFQELQAKNDALTATLEQQTATAEILRVISSSPTDLAPVFEAILESSLRLCEGNVAAVWQFDGAHLHFAKGKGGSTEGVAYLQQHPLPLGTYNPTPQAGLERRPVHVLDVFADARYRPLIAPDTYGTVPNSGTVLAVPLLRGAELLGVITIWRHRKCLFSDRQVAMVTTFADQAVIAIENVRLFNELQARNGDLTESLEQQTATAEILRVISSSPTDITPVLNAVADNAARLCEANDVVVMMNEGEVLRTVKSTGPFGERFGAEFTIPVTHGSAAGRAVIERKTVRVADFESESDEEFPIGREHRRIYGNHGAMATPLLHGDAVLGVIAVLRRDVRPFSDRQRTLLQTFADQAAIAIANVRLFNETKEALEQQTATGEILRVISSSPTDLAPVFDAVAKSVSRLCDAPDVVIVRAEGGSMRFAASVGPFGQTFGRELAVPLARGTVAGRAVLERRTVHVDDLAAEPEDEYPEGKALQRRYGHRTMLAAPLLLGDTALGAIAVLRKEVRPFSEKQIALLRTFADQSVIAIENVRLFNETKEALEKQTAISEILRVISASPTDVQPVFEAIVRSAVTLCGSKDGAVFRYDGERLHYAAGFDQTPEWVDAVQSRYPMRPEASTIAGRAILELSVVQIDDVLADPAYDHERAIKGGWRRMLAVPMLREGVPLGVIVVSWPQPGPTPKSQEDLLRTFADQAVIAIENVRLFNETKEALDHQKASAEVLQVISSSVADTQPVFDKILESCERLFQGSNVGISPVGDDGAVRLAAYHGPNREELERHYPVPLSEESGVGMAILHRRVVHYPDVQHGADVPDYVRRGAGIAGNKSIMLAPMLWEGRGIGAIFVGRNAVGEFSEKEIALLKTFADQAVIAIQNARLFNEIREKSHQLEIANQHKSAFLANMSHELRTPLNAVIGFSEMLAARYFGDLTEKQAEYVNDIHGSGKHLLSLINDILDLSKIEAGRMELEAGEFDLRAALENAITLVRERAQRGGVALRLDTDPALGAFVGDERKLKQVVLNLLSNAVKFTPRGGTVDVAAKRADGTVEISVRDTGQGIAPEDQEAIFEAFRQVGTDVTRKREGTGLGLALTRRFVELHGGTIRVASAVGKGSTFTVRLPIRHGE